MIQDKNRQVWRDSGEGDIWEPGEGFIKGVRWSEQQAKKMILSAEFCKDWRGVVDVKEAAAMKMGVFASWTGREGCISEMFWWTKGKDLILARP